LNGNAVQLAPSRQRCRSAPRGSVKVSEKPEFQFHPSQPIPRGACRLL